MIYVTVIGTKPQQIIDITQNVYLNCKKGMEETANETRKHMTDIIGLGYQGRGKRDGSKGELENAIQVEKVMEDSFGVGNISSMNKLVPYWGLLNAGGMVAVKARRVMGYFIGPNHLPDSKFSGTGAGKEEFTWTPRGFRFATFTGSNLSGGGGSSMMIVKNPMGAVNYIEKTKDWLKNMMGMKFYSWTKSIKFKKK